MDSPQHQGLPSARERADSARPDTTVKYTVKSRNLSRSDASRCIPPGLFNSQTPGCPEIASRVEEPGPSSRLALPPGSSRVCDYTFHRPLDIVNGPLPAFIRAAHGRKTSPEEIASGPSRHEQPVSPALKQRGLHRPYAPAPIGVCRAMREVRIGFAPVLAHGG